MEAFGAFHGAWTEDSEPTPWTPAAGVRTHSGVNDWFIGTPEDNTAGSRLLFYDRGPSDTVSITELHSFRDHEAASVVRVHPG